MIPEITSSVKGQAGGLALLHQYGREHMGDIGQLGGRPRALTIDDIHSNITSAAQTNERRHGKGLKELLGLWKQRACPVTVTQEQALCLSEAAGGKEGPGVSLPYSPRPVCRPERNLGPGSLLGQGEEEKL